MAATVLNSPRAIQMSITLGNASGSNSRDPRPIILLGASGFEDAVVASLAESGHCQYIVSRNTGDFKHSPIPVITPAELLALMDEKAGP